MQPDTSPQFVVNLFKKSDSEKLNNLYRFLEAQYVSGSFSREQFRRTLEILSD